MRAKKSLSQFFLQEPFVIQKILSYLQFGESSCFLEIGPGKGALTKEVYNRSFFQFWAIEKDDALAKDLQKKHPLLHVFQEDILSFDFSFLPKGKTQVFGNLPYHLSQEILYIIIIHSHLFLKALFMLQKELVEKLLSPKSLIATFVSCFSKVEPLFVVSKKAFSPNPLVDSAVFSLSFFPERTIDKKAFFQFLQKLYQGKRKKLSSSLKLFFPEKYSRFEYTGVILQKRVEECTKEELFFLFTHF